MKKLFSYFSSIEIGLWISSVAWILLSFLFNDVYGFVSWQRMKKRQCEE